MNSAASAVKALNAEEKAAEAQFKATGDAQSYQEEKLRILNEKMEEQRKAVEAAQAAVKKLTEQGFARNSREMQTWRTKLANAQTALSQTEGKLKSLNVSIDNTSTTMDNGAQAAADYSAQLEAIGGAISVEGAIRSIDRVTDKITDGIRTVGNLAKEIWNLEADAAHWADEVITNAAQSGMDVETYQAWQFAAQIVDTSVEQIISSSTQLNGRLLRENAEVAGAINAIGVAITNENGQMRDSQDVFWDTIRALHAMDDATERNNRAQQIFGSGWRNLSTLIDQGAEAWDNAVEEARQYYVLNEDQVGRLGSLDDTLNRLGAGLTTARLQVLSALAPVFEDIANAMSTAVNAFNEFLQTEEGQAALDALGTALQGLLETFLDTSPEGIRNAVTVVTNVITGLTNALNWLIENKDAVIAAITAIAGIFLISAGLKIALQIAEGIIAAKNLVNMLKTGGAAGGADILNKFRTFFDNLFGGGNGNGNLPNVPDGKNAPGAGSQLTGEKDAAVEALKSIQGTAESILSLLQEKLGTPGEGTQTVTFAEGDPALQALNDLVTEVRGFRSDFSQHNTENPSPDLTEAEGYLRDISQWTKTDASGIGTDVDRIESRTDRMALTLENVAADAERIAWYLENSGAIRGASKALSMGAADWAALLSGGTSVSSYLGDILGLSGIPGANGAHRASGGVYTSGVSYGGGSGSQWNRNQYAEELATLMAYELGDFLTEETARMLYEGLDANGNLLEPEQIVPQVLAELAAYVDHAGSLPALRRRGEEPVEEPAPVPPEIDEIQNGVDLILTTIGGLVESIDTNVKAILDAMPDSAEPQQPPLTEPIGVRLVNPNPQLSVYLAGQAHVVPVRLAEPTEPISVTMSGLMDIVEAVRSRLAQILARIIQPMSVLATLVSPEEPIWVRMDGPGSLVKAPQVNIDGPETVTLEVHEEEAVAAVEAADAASAARDGELRPHILIIPHWFQILNSDMQGLETAVEMLIDSNPWNPGSDIIDADWGSFLNRPAYQGHSTSPDPVYALVDLLYGGRSSGGTVHGWRTVSPTDYSRPYGTGGRVDRGQFALIGEDGTEYIIPIDKPERALELTMAMLGESSALRSRVVGQLLASVGSMSRAGGARAAGGGGGMNAATIAEAISQAAGGGGIGGTGNGGVTARIYMDKTEVGYMVADTVNNVMGARVSASRRGE